MATMVHSTTAVETREQMLECLAGDEFDVLVIGGGIVGAGVARDAAMRGLRTALVEQHDFASGTSSRSSRLLHGGIRYLAQGRLGLVREASKEKSVAARIAPHLAEPLPFLFPTRRGTPWSWWKLSVGVRLYDLLCGGRNFGRSSSLGFDATTEMLPGLAREGLTGAVRYFDALTNDARLVLDTLRSAARHGAAVCNYLRMTTPERVGEWWQCEVRETFAEGGAGEGGQSPFAPRTPQMGTVPGRPQMGTVPGVVRARAVVNATGPWSDRIPLSKTTLRVTKGVHLVVDRARFPVPEAVVLAEGDRLVFAIPWGERVILGTTDTDYRGELNEPPCDAADVEYVLGVVNATFPAAHLEPSDLVSHWSGLRPLVADPHGNPSDISRRHEIHQSNPAWWDVTGGKLTTYRLMAEETVDQIVRRLGVAARRCATADEPLLAPGEMVTSGVTPPAPSVAVVEHCVRREWAQRLDDVMFRRTSWRHYHHDHVALATTVAGLMAPLCGWSDGEVRAELERYQRIAAR